MNSPDLGPILKGTPHILEAFSLHGNWDVAGDEYDERTPLTKLPTCLTRIRFSFSFSFACMVTSQVGKPRMSILWEPRSTDHLSGHLSWRKMGGTFLFTKQKKGCFPSSFASFFFSNMLPAG
eukprot:TRINITY_DN10580_c0_g1_i6.p1 TRINITY_DN10580_c0_g1~~TRINITY_DN10580_c0_g1_i6.p1  ORF type:complete len:122 (-),score=6.88 TRINITY_DN10580_c0_g1_i6:6-371(-)